ncbi:MAG: hypothetical protein EAX89_16340, partial [Candidatus Lokiarchaeota archaeon]|nr:hypothetical protein [Candidatus Lokiarchaeota archaeon]
SKDLIYADVMVKNSILPQILINWLNRVFALNMLLQTNLFAASQGQSFKQEKVPQIISIS